MDRKSTPSHLNYNVHYKEKILPTTSIPTELKQELLLLLEYLRLGHGLELGLVFHVDPHGLS